MINKTLEYYNENANNFLTGTKNVDFSAVQDRFISFLPKGGRILDFGCGSGRDAKYFLDKGFVVDAIDGSEELCRLASEYTGIAVRTMLFSELDENALYDGIWACASILHLPKTEMRTVIEKMIRAAKMGGYIYSSFKYGDFEGYRNGRYFTDYTEDSFGQIIKDISVVKIVTTWMSEDVRPGRGGEKWLNLILQKVKVP